MKMKVLRFVGVFHMCRRGSEGEGEGIGGGKREREEG
jgi:hypothetical protein